jgi:hypothetical protein
LPYNRPLLHLVHCFLGAFPRFPKGECTLASDTFGTSPFPMLIRYIYIYIHVIIRHIYTRYIYVWHLPISHSHSSSSCIHTSLIRLVPPNILSSYVIYTLYIRYICVIYTFGTSPFPIVIRH